MTMQIADIIQGMLAPYCEEQSTAAQPFADSKPCLEKVFLGGCNISAQWIPEVAPQISSNLL